MSTKKLINTLREKYQRNEKLPELRIDEVENILQVFFENYEHKRGSHIIVKDSRLKAHWQIFRNSQYGPNGQFTIPAKHGQKVKSNYVKSIIAAIEICEFMEEKSEKKD